MKMFYEAVSWIEQNNKNSSKFFKDKDKAMSIMRRYIMWLWINEIEFGFSIEKRRRFLEECYIESQGDVLIGILGLDIENEDKSILISFLYLSNQEIEELLKALKEAKDEVKKVYDKERNNYYSNEKNILKQLEDPEYMNRLVNLHFDSGVKVIPYISLIDKDSMNLHYQQNHGVLLVIGHEYDIKSEVFIYNHESSLEKLKALGDETRLKIVESIVEKPMSASELASLLSLTIPTIAHHLKVLASAEIICACINNEETSKVTYEIYNQGIENLMDNLKKLIAGGVI